MTEGSMFRLYRNEDFHKICSPSDYARIISPDVSLRQAERHYDLDHRHYFHFGPSELPRFLAGEQNRHPAGKGYADTVYDNVKKELETGQLIGADLMADWNSFINPFYINDRGQLVCGNADHYHDWFVRDIMNGYRSAVASTNGISPPSTRRTGNDRIEPAQHAQAG